MTARVGYTEIDCSPKRSPHVYLKTGWHLLLVGAAVIEYQMASTPFRRMLLMACAGWHLGAAHNDWTGK